MRGVILFSSEILAASSIISWPVISNSALIECGLLILVVL